MKLKRNFYKKDAIILAKDLLGKVLVRPIDGKILRARIVETEAYTGGDDKASHTYKGKRTKRTESMYMEGGHFYIYFVYGMYYMTNIVAGLENEGQGVLLRAIEPLSEIDTFAYNRFEKNYQELSSYQKRNLTNGPGKLSKALDITKKFDGLDLVQDQIFLEDDGYKNFDIVESKRIGIAYAEESKDLLYRFYIKGNKYVSIK